MASGINQSISTVLPKPRAGGEARAVPAGWLAALKAICSFIFVLLFSEKKTPKPQTTHPRKPKAKEDGKKNRSPVRILQ